MSLERVNPRRGKKSKKGCQTCKIRHVKCDETRPACKKCTGTGRTCDYLLEPQVPVIVTSQAPSNEQFLNPTAFEFVFPASVLPEPSWNSGRNSPWSAHDARSVLCFDYFREVCCAELKGYFSSRLWEFFLLQVAHAEPAIRSAVLALSAMHYSQFACMDHESQTIWRQHAMTHFTNAVRELNAKLDASLNSHKLALIASLTFTYYELLSGEETTSLLHLRGGANILSSMCESPGSSIGCSKLQAPQSHSSGFSPLPLPDMMAPQPPTLEQDPVSIPSDVDLSELASAFARAIIEVSCYGVRYRFSPLAIPILPTSLSSLTDPNGARYHLDLIIAYMYTTMDFRLEPLRTLPAEALSEQTFFFKQTVSSLLHQWNTLFHNYQSNNQHKLSPKDQTISLILTIQSRLAYLKLITHFFEDESVYDHYIDEFARITDLCEQVLASSTSTTVLPSNSTPSSSSSSPSSTNLSFHSNSKAPLVPASTSSSTVVPLNQQPSIRFTTDSAIVHPLYFITLKCRSPVLRRRALALLAKSGREAAHDGHKLAAAAAWIIEREEADSASFMPTINQVYKQQAELNQEHGWWRSDSSIAAGVDRSVNFPELHTHIVDGTIPLHGSIEPTAIPLTEPILASTALTTPLPTASLAAPMLPSGLSQDTQMPRLESRIRTPALRFCPDGESVQILCARKPGRNLLDNNDDSWIYFGGLAWYDGIKRGMSVEQERDMEGQVVRFGEWHGSVR